MSIVNKESTQVKFGSLIDLVEYQAERLPNNIVYRYLKDGEILDDSLTFSEFSLRIKKLAAVIQAHCEPGDRALLLYPSSLDYIVAFFACVYAGVIAVPAYPPQNQRRDWTRLQSILEDSKASLLLSNNHYSTGIEQWLSQTELSFKPKFLTSSYIHDNGASLWRCPNIDNDTTAFLQYSSGSTGMPKGIMVSHGNLLHNEEIIQQSVRSHVGTKFVGWLPIYHDMGLIGNVMQPLYCGGELTIMSPASVIQKPIRWLKAISDQQASISGGPNFIYDICVRQITEEQKGDLDLSHWQIAFNGAEPINPDTLDRFSTSFSSCGFRPEMFFPCYGLAENTLMVSAKTFSEQPKIISVRADKLRQDKAVVIDEYNLDNNLKNSIRLISSGNNLMNQDVRIVTPGDNNIQCSDGNIGEIWVKGKSVAQGYWNQPDVSETIFRAHISSTNEGPFMRTGDYGFFHGGNMYITGRIKEIVIVHGENHYPQDIEKTVQNVSELFRKGGGAAFSIDINGQERLVVIQELLREGMRERNKDQVIAAIARTQAAIAEIHHLELYDLVLVKYGSISKTTSGKIQRYMNRKHYLNNELSTLYTLLDDQCINELQSHRDYVEPGSEIEKELCLIWQEVLGVECVGMADNFFHLGGNSLLAAKLVVRVKEKFQVDFPLDTFFTLSSIKNMAIAIDEQEPKMTDDTFDRMSSLLDELEV